jgi:hypothetical protein
MNELKRSMLEDEKVKHYRKTHPVHKDWECPVPNENWGTEDAEVLGAFLKVKHEKKLGRPDIDYDWNHRVRE